VAINVLRTLHCEVIVFRGMPILLDSINQMKVRIQRIFVSMCVCVCVHTTYDRKFMNLRIHENRISPQIMKIGIQECNFLQRIY
jgi:hypothetical protein